MTNNLEQRLSRLEVAGSTECVVMWRHHTETDEQAVSRWHADHPGQRIEGRASRVIIMQWSDPAPLAAETEKGTP